MSDVELLEQHRQGSDDAFAQLVRAHLGWVYGVARRRVGDAHLAEDVAQAVFVLLHRKMPRFSADGAMISWLHRAAWYAADVAARNQRRRQHRETEAAMLHGERASAPADEWNELAPLLDELVGKLSRIDREAILLRYYRDMTFAQVGQQIGSTEEAARKRVDRAVEKLRQMAGKRGAQVSAASLGAGLLNVRIAPPPGLIATATTAATAASGSVLTASIAPILKGATFMMASTKILIGTAVLGVVVLAGGGLWMATPSDPPRAPDSALAAEPGAPTSRPWTAGYYPLLSPFTAIRWSGDIPQVQVEGTWYEWIALNDQSVRQIVAAAQNLDPKDWQKRIGEDMVELLTRMGHAPGTAVTLQLSTLGDNPTLITLPRIPMTPENRMSIMQQGNRNADAQPQRQNYPRLAPYSAIRWHDQTPEIEVNGTWYEWHGLNDMTIEQLVTTAQKLDPTRWQMRIGEDLVELLARSGVQLGNTVTLKVKTLGDNPTVSTLTDVPMTAENRQAVWKKRLESESSASQPAR